MTGSRGWGFTNRPAVVVGNAVGRGLIGGSGAKATVVSAIEDGSFIPSVHGKDNSYAEVTRITVEEAGILQGFGWRGGDYGLQPESAEGDEDDPRGRLLA